MTNLLMMIDVELALGMGTSEQLDMGSPSIKRFSSLHSKGNPEKVVQLAEAWKSKGAVRNSSIKSYNTHERIFMAADNVTR